MKSKSLTIFLILLISFLCYIKCYQEGKSFSYKPKGGKKTLKVPLKIKTPSKNSNENVGDFQVCHIGKNLGLIAPSASCVVQYPSFCHESVVRKQDLPPMSRTKRAKLAKEAIRTSKGSNVAIKNIKKRFRWTLSGRSDRYKKPKITLRQKKAVQAAKKKQIKRQANLREANSIARKILQRRSESRTSTKKGLKREAKKISKKVTLGNFKPLRIALGLRKKPVPKRFARVTQQRRTQTQRDLSKGNFCVKSVSWNLSHCCFFTKRIEAQHFANGLPVPRVFEKRLKEGRRAIYLDNARIANEKIVGSTKDLKEVKKIVHKRKEAIKKGGKKK
jgi:hypothetical protein